jgi:deoxycytidine triphosphate deaminase
MEKSHKKLFKNIDDAKKQLRVKSWVEYSDGTIEVTEEFTDADSNEEIELPEHQTGEYRDPATGNFIKFNL